MKCKKCGKEIHKYKDESEQVFEGMHRLCFHFEYEHKADPDEACDDLACPNLKIEIYEKALREIGLEPDAIIQVEIKKRWETT